MAKEHSGGIIIATGFRLDDPQPIDDRLVVASTSDLLNVNILPNIYDGILVSVTSNDEVYRWNGNNRSLLSNWEKIAKGSGGSGTGFPYAGSDSLDTDPKQAVITGSLLISGSGHITASSINANSFIISDQTVGSLDTLKFGGNEGILLGDTSQPLNIQANAINLGRINNSGDIEIGRSETSTTIYSPLTASIISASDTIKTQILSASNAELTNLSINGVTFESVESETTVISSTTSTLSGSVIIGSGSSIDPEPPISNKHQITGSVEITGSGIFPNSVGTIDLGDINRKFNNLFAVNTFFGGVHEINLETEGLDEMQEGTVLSLKNGMLHPCEREADPLVMGIVSKGENFPIVLGAEPILITGKIKEGDYIITSKIKGHGKGVNPKHIYNKKLFGKIIAQAIESGSGKSHIIKAMVRKM